MHIIKSNQIDSNRYRIVIEIVIDIEIETKPI